MTVHNITIEHRPVTQSAAVCSCGWIGNPQFFLEWAQADGAEHQAGRDPVDVSGALRAELNARLNEAP